MTPNAEQIIEQAPRIPSLPTVALRVLEMTRAANTDLREMAALIENDQGLASKILRTVNSSFFGLSKPCGTISQALVYLGMDAVRMLVLGFSMVESIDGGGEHDVTFDYVDYWRRAIHSASAARELAALTHTCNPDEAFLAALLQDIGMVMLNCAFGDRYLQAIDMAGECHHTLVAIERQALEIDHAQMGAALAGKWNLPPQHVEAIRCHHDAESAKGPHRELAGIVELAGCAAETAAEQGDCPTSEQKTAVVRFRTLAKERLGFTVAQADAVIKIMASRAVELAWLLQVDVGRDLDVEHILAQAEDQRTEQILTVIREKERIECDIATATPSASCSREDFDRELARYYEAAIDGGTPLTVLLGEVDRLATITESLSWPSVESLLRAVEARLENCMADSGRLSWCGRVVGGFTVLVPGMDRLGAAKMAEVMRRAIESQPIVLSAADGEHDMSSPLPVTMSFGAAVLDQETGRSIASAEALRGLAEQALQAARAAGRNSVRVYNPAARKRAA